MMRTWQEEIEDAFSAMDNETFNVTWQASTVYEAGTMIAELMPIGRIPNQNNFFINPKLKDSIISALNSGKILLRDAHSKMTRDILGVVTKGYEKDGKIYMEADVDDPVMDALLKKHKDSLGVSIGGVGNESRCTVCHKKVMGMRGCLEHPHAPIEVMDFRLMETSITSDPAWSTSMVKEYK